MPKRLGRPPGLILDGPEIYRLRIDRGFTVAELAAQIRRHPECVRRAERGGPVSDVITSRIAKALGVSMSDITGRAGDESDPETADVLSA
jgi:ribosome-binding protein aMBF1 (putative translation factor)